MMTRIVGITFSAFDLLHPGHLGMLANCKANCDYLIAGLQTDPTIDRPEKNKPVQTIYERYRQLAACKYVDEIIPYDTEEQLNLILATTVINRRFMGDEYRLVEYTGKQMCAKLGIEVIYTPRLHNLSTTELRNRLKGSV